MIELSHERIEQIVLKETPKTEALPVILRSVYIRYMHLHERFFADIDALNDDTIADLNKYHEETKSLIKYYYMDIPEDICRKLMEFDNNYSGELLGADWHKKLFDCFNDFKAEKEDENDSEACLKAAFSKQKLADFYGSMDGILREGFGTESKDDKDTMSGLGSLLFGEEKQ